MGLEYSLNDGGLLDRVLREASIRAAREAEEGVMLFGVYERMLLIRFLPGQGGALFLQLRRRVAEAASFNEAELEALKLREQRVCRKCSAESEHPHYGTDKLCPECGGPTKFAGDVRWDRAADLQIGEKEIHVPEPVAAVVRDRLRELDKDGKIGEAQLEFYLKFNPDQRLGADAESGEPGGDEGENAGGPA